MKILIKFIGLIIVGLLILVGLFFILPESKAELVYQYPAIPDAPAALEAFVSENESKQANIKPGNMAHIVWADSSKTVTPYSMVYLHGFSASHEEGGTVHDRLAEKFGMNTYYARMAFHGIEGREGMSELTAETYFASALEAVAIGKKIGEKVILVGTSTGATLGLPIMAYDQDIYAGIFYSPNIALANENTKLMTKPFGMTLAESINGGEYFSFVAPEGAEQYWTCEYSLSAVRELQELIDATMTEEIFEKIEQPVLFCSYYKNEEMQDRVVSVAAMRTCMEQLSTPEKFKIFKELPTTEAHAMCSQYHSKDINAPYDESVKFLEIVMN